MSDKNIRDLGKDAEQDIIISAKDVKHKERSSGLTEISQDKRGDTYLFGLKSNISEKEKITPKENSFKISRELLRQQTKEQNRVSEDNSPDLFSSAFDYETKAPITTKESVFLQVLQGFSLKDLAQKVLIGLAQELYRQSKLFKNGNVTGINPEYYKSKSGSSESEIVTLEKSEEKRVLGGTGSDSRVVIGLKQFTKLISGGGSVGGKDLKAVEETLYKFDKQFIKFSDGKNTIKLRFLTIDGTIKDEVTGAKSLLIRLTPIFNRSIANDFALLPTDILQRIGGKKMKDITWRLLNVLTLQHSFKNGDVYKISKRKLYDKIAVLGSYKKQKARLRGDYKDAITTMFDIGIITGYIEEPGAEIICTFNLNPQWAKKNNEDETPLLIEAEEATN